MNLSGFTKKELLEMSAKRCKHNHTYLEHPNCYLSEKEKEKKTGYFDIETGGLNANFDYVLTWVIKTRGKKEYKCGIIDQKDILSYNFDKKILKELKDTIQKYDLIITYNGCRFDIPFIRTRTLSHKMKFLPFGSIQHKDVYFMVRNRMRLHKSSLESACASLGIKGKNHIKGNFWMRAKIGDPKSLEYVLSHNIKDCDILEKLHNKLLEYVRDTTRSI